MEKKKGFTFRLPVTTQAKIKAVASVRGQTIGDTLTDLIDKEFKGLDRKQKAVANDLVKQQLEVSK